MEEKIDHHVFTRSPAK